MILYRVYVAFNVEFDYYLPNPTMPFAPRLRHKHLERIYKSEEGSHIYNFIDDLVHVQLHKLDLVHVQSHI